MFMINMEIVRLGLFTLNNSVHHLLIFDSIVNVKVLHRVNTKFETSRNEIPNCC